MTLSPAGWGYEVDNIHVRFYTPDDAPKAVSAKLTFRFDFDSDGMINDLAYPGTVMKAYGLDGYTIEIDNTNNNWVEEYSGAIRVDFVDEPLRLFLFEGWAWIVLQLTYGNPLFWKMYIDIEYTDEENNISFRNYEWNFTYDDCPALGDLTGNGTWSGAVSDDNEVIAFTGGDLATLVICVISGHGPNSCFNNCGPGDLPSGGSCYGCAGNMNGDYLTEGDYAGEPGYNTLDIVLLGNCILHGTCGDLYGFEIPEG